jgi:hypothetical protein
MITRWAVTGVFRLLWAVPSTCAAQVLVHHWDIGVVVPAVRFVDIDPSIERVRQQSSAQPFSRSV